MKTVFEIGDEVISDREVVKIVGIKLENDGVVYELDCGQTAEESYLINQEAFEDAKQWLSELVEIIQEMAVKIGTAEESQK